MISVVLAAGLLASPAHEAQVIAHCQAWYAGRTFNGDFETQSVKGGLCLNGLMAAGDAEVFKSELNRFDSAQPLILVVRSGGGDANETLEMAETLLERPATVIAYDICASSCANYLLTAGHRKVVWQDTLLAWHGGVSWEQLADVAGQIRLALEASGEAEPVILSNIETNRQALGRLIDRQDAFLLKAQISPTLFRWMGLINHMTPAEQQRHCATNAPMLIYPPALVARFGLSIDQYDGPTDQAAVDSLVQHKGLAMSLCYWQE